MDKNNRSNFSGKLGFVLAAAGSAVGLGNLWRFPYLAAKYGGGMFLLVYLILAVTFGYALMIAEISIGRKTGLSAIGAFEKLNKKWSFVGYLGALVPMIILPYYCVIGGWVGKFLSLYASGNGSLAASTNEEGVAYFLEFFALPTEPLVWFGLFLAITAVVVIAGVDKGIETASKVMMPVLVLLTIIISAMILTMDGAIDGLIYYLKPNPADFSAVTVLAAMGQLFFSLSLAMGIMITYGSYMKKDVSIDASVKQIEVFDCAIAFLAGLMIIPAVFVAGEQANIKAGPSLMFIVLPKVFEKMSAGGILGAVFFALVFLAALTSSISLMEAVVSNIQDKTKCKRGVAIVATLGICLLVGVPSSLGHGPWAGVSIMGFNFLDFFDFISNSVMMPIVALLTCIVVGYVIKPSAIIDEVESVGTFGRKKLFVVMIKYICPIFIVAILVSSVLQGLGIFSM
ncbi:MAG: sodium-dependent transporter [Clostridiales bacterium]|nr:sodium-dependent transporter [Clostridiales bacterium]